MADLFEQAVRARTGVSPRRLPAWARKGPVRRPGERVSPTTVVSTAGMGIPGREPVVGAATAAQLQAARRRQAIGEIERESAGLKADVEQASRLQREFESAQREVESIRLGLRRSGVMVDSRGGVRRSSADKRAWTLAVSNKLDRLEELRGEVIPLAAGEYNRFVEAKDIMGRSMLLVQRTGMYYGKPTTAEGILEEAKGIRRVQTSMGEVVYEGPVARFRRTPAGEPVLVSGLGPGRREVVSPAAIPFGWAPDVRRMAVPEAGGRVLRWTKEGKPYYSTERIKAATRAEVEKQLALTAGLGIAVTAPGGLVAGGVRGAVGYGLGWAGFGAGMAVAEPFVEKYIGKPLREIPYEEEWLYQPHEVVPGAAKIVAGMLVGRGFQKAYGAALPAAEARFLKGLKPRAKFKGEIAMVTTAERTEMLAAGRLKEFIPGKGWKAKFARTWYGLRKPRVTPYYEYRADMTAIAESTRIGKIKPFAITAERAFPTEGALYESLKITKPTGKEWLAIKTPKYEIFKAEEVYFIPPKYGMPIEQLEPWTKAIMLRGETAGVEFAQIGYPKLPGIKVTRVEKPFGMEMLRTYDIQYAGKIRGAMGKEFLVTPGKVFGEMPYVGDFWVKGAAQVVEKGGIKTVFAGDIAAKFGLSKAYLSEFIVEPSRLLYLERGVPGKGLAAAITKAAGKKTAQMQMLKEATAYKGTVASMRTAAEQSLGKLASKMKLKLAPALKPKPTVLVTVSKAQKAMAKQLPKYTVAPLKVAAVPKFRVGRLPAIGVKVAAALKTKGIVGERLQFAPAEKLRVGEKIKVASLVMPAQRLRVGERLKVSERFAPAERARIGERLRVGERFAFAQRMRMGERLKVAERLKPLMQVPPPPPPLPPLPPPPGGWLFLGRMPKFAARKKLSPGFDVFAKVSGKYKKLSKLPLVKESALGVGAAFVELTPAATFKLVPTKKLGVRLLGAPRFRGERFRFPIRKGKPKRGLTFIERLPWRIKEREEIIGIPYKGLAAQRQRRWAASALGFRLPKKRKGKERKKKRR